MNIWQHVLADGKFAPGTDAYRSLVSLSRCDGRDYDNDGDSLDLYSAAMHAVLSAGYSKDSALYQALADKFGEALK